MEKKHVVSDRGSFILKLDFDLWQKLKEHLEAKYEKYFVEISTETETDLFKSMDDAYESICWRREQIERIKIVAKSPADVLNITIKNKRELSGINNVKLYAECSNFDMENGVRLNIMEEIGKHRAQSCGMRIAAGLYIILLMKHMSQVLLHSEMISYPVLTSLMITIVAAALMYIAFVPLAERIIYGRDKIKFLVSYENIAEFQRMKKADNIFSAGLFVVAAVLGALSFLF